MADELRIGLVELLHKAQMGQDADFLKEGVWALSQALMEMELEEHIGAARHERTEGRSGHRNGYRERTWDTRAGAIELKVPRVRDGKLFPLIAGTAPTGRESAICGDAGGVRTRGLHKEGR